MTIANIFNEKKKSKSNLLKKNNLIDIRKALGLIFLKEELINDLFLDALAILPANFIIISNGNNIGGRKNIILLNNLGEGLAGFDFIVCDGFEDDLKKYLINGVVPIIYRNHDMISLFSEFKAKTIEGNSFIYEKNELFDIFYAIIRFLENYKFTYDNKALVKNVLSNT